MGGGQCCDIAGVIREIDKAGFVIVPRQPTNEILTAAKPYMDSWSSNLAWWDAMLNAAQS
jgi:hypothetical protein